MNPSQLNREFDQTIDELAVMIKKEKMYDCASLIECNSCNAPLKAPVSPITVIATDKEGAGHDGTKIIALNESIARDVTQWMYKVIDHYSFDRKIVAIGMNLFYRFISSTSGESKAFELATATSLYMAIKLFGPKLSRNDNLILNFVRMSNSRFDESHIIQMEMNMLYSLSWKVHPVTPQDFIHYLVRILSYYDDDLDQSCQQKLTVLSSYIVELIVFDPQFMHDAPSSLACAGIAIAMKGINASCSTSSLLPFFNHDVILRHTLNDLVERLNVYLTKITPTLDDDELDVDPTGILYKQIISSQ